MRSPKIKREPSSFRDPSGFVFYENETVLRQVSFSYKENFDFLFDSGLYDELTEQKLLLAHTKVANRSPEKEAYVTLQTQKLPFISYPYEWTFGQLQDAALLTLQIQKLALAKGMTLKDASSYNVQFLDGKPILIDLLSFEKYEDGSPWVAYKQFCQHFLGPLLLMSKVDVRLNQLLRAYIDGIPLDLVSKLLPKSSYFSFATATHIHLHAKNQQQFASERTNVKQRAHGLSKLALLGIIDSLESSVKSLRYGEKNTEWGEYYTFTNYSDAGFQNKKKLVESFLKVIKPKTVWDIGANSGEFSRISSQAGIFTLSSDLDPIAVEKNYQYLKKNGDKNLLPLIIDLTNPSSAIGWANSERHSLIERGPAELVMALALVHHLAISNNLPLARIAEFCRQIGTALIIEFVPKEDSQVQKLLATREDIFGNYNKVAFEKEFSNYFKIIKKSLIPDTQRTLYLMKAQ